jgi:hypothetical protein
VAKKKTVKQIKQGEHIRFVGGTFDGEEGTFDELVNKQAWVYVLKSKKPKKCIYTKVNKEHIQYVGPNGPCP